MGLMTQEERLVEAIVDVASTPGPGLDVAGLLHSLAATGVDLLDAHSAAVQVADENGALETLASCGEDPRYIELFADHSDDGPGADSYRKATVISAVDLDLEESRWPGYTAKARALGFRSVHGIPMRSRDHVVGGLSLLRTRAGPLVETELVVAQCIATVATLSVVQDRQQRSHERTRRQLEHALRSRIIIEQAKGFLAHDCGETTNQAFTRLRNYSRQRGLRISTVAEEVIAGRLDLR